jgi:SAM-dependent methyltransferase
MSDDSGPGLSPEAVAALYNEKVVGQFRGEYEDHRWHKSASGRAQYDATRRFVEGVVGRTPSFDSYLEVGPGPGTWTMAFLAARPQAAFDLVDISAEMLAPARSRLTGANARFFEQDFLAFEPDRTYDVFFSSRAIEYMDKRRAADRIAASLRSGGTGTLITKQPRRGSRRRGPDSVHSGQVDSRELVGILQDAGLVVGKVEPVVLLLPAVRVPRLDRVASRLVAGRAVVRGMNPLIESYGVSFKKP